GMESMSQAPYLLPNARAGLRMGNQTLVDSMIHDGLWDPYGQRHMGSCAEHCAKERGFSRQQQDEYAMRSFRRAQDAQKSGKFVSEIAAVTIPGRKGEQTVVALDEGPTKAQFDKIPTLKPAFDPNGTVTAANASSVNDGAAALVLMSSERAQQLGVKPLARLVSSAVNAHEPLWFTTAPAEAMRRALRAAGWQAQDVDLFEVNEAFAVVALAAQRELSIPDDRLNVWGGAIALGHPIGASGARIVATLCSALIDRGLRRGVASICIGGGEATAVCVERLA
nr:thiolase family protein [Planctomycetota bacterium]